MCDANRVVERVRVQLTELVCTLAVADFDGIGLRRLRGTTRFAANSASQMGYLRLQYDAIP